MWHNILIFFAWETKCGFFGLTFECMLIDDQQRMDLHLITGRVLSHGAGSHGDLPTGAGAHHGGVGAGTRAGGVQPVTIL